MSSEKKFSLLFLFVLMENYSLSKYCIDQYAVITFTIASPIPNTKYPIPNTKYPIPNTQYPIPNTQYSISNTQYTILNT